MTMFGQKTDCGTIACAAGHASLDPWFRKRGFTGEFDILGQLQPTRHREWADMIEDFFIGNTDEEFLTWSTSEEQLYEELKVLTENFYSGGYRVGDVIRSIESDLKRLKKLKKG
jgi:hypothetical protein